MPKVVACIIARTVSQRLPLKVLRDINEGTSMIDFLIQRVKGCSAIDKVYICTSRESVDDIFEDIAKRNNVQIYRGSSDAVIERMIEVGEIEQADIVLRITGDNPFSSIEYVSRQIEFLLQEKLDYVRLVDVPIGVAVEVIKFESLKDCYAKMDPAISEYLMLFLFEPKQYNCGIVKPFENDFSYLSVTVDTPEDLIRAKNIARLCDKQNLLIDIISLLIDESKNEFFPKKAIQAGGKIKYPYGEEITFEQFSNDMQRRKENSKIVRLYE
ncbi:hypothetical protein H9X57_06750 [Flavobacterium piscinae]|uniref:cytidylyltransferase domain-containing protein n=1 Tax=Flavobacterium piscinae TaxID=2506424 RepID=UPI00198FA0FB|nr:hypothetical protein [Flavobacterium piscinae]MBC8883222.1 hypothetical protein [Flavobacterium piscinae]